MILADTEIRLLVQDDFVTNPDGSPDHERLYRHIQPASLDFPLEDAMEGFLLQPQEFKLVSTHHVFKMPPHLSGQIAGKSTWARKGLLVHPSAGFVDPGFHGQLTLEIYNLSAQVLQINPGETVAQMIYFLMTRAPSKLYKGKYNGQQGPTGAR